MTATLDKNQKKNHILCVRIFTYPVIHLVFRLCISGIPTIVCLFVCVCVCVCASQYILSFQHFVVLFGWYRPTTVLLLPRSWQPSSRSIWKVAPVPEWGWEGAIFTVQLGLRASYILPPCPLCNVLARNNCAFNPLAPRVQKIKSGKLTSTDIYWLNS